MENRIQKELLNEIERLKKVNRVLIKRVEDPPCCTENSFGQLAEHILFGKKVDERTRELKVTAQELALQKIETEKVMKSLPGAILLVSSDLRILEHHLNNFEQAVLDYLTPRESRRFNPAFSRNLLRHLDMCEDSNEVVRFTHSFKKENTEYFLRCSVTRLSKNRYTLFLLDESVQHRQGIQLRNQEVKLAQLAQLSSVGEVAGSIAHEINTPLCTIMMLAGSLEKKLKNNSKEEILHVANKITSTVNTISKIIKGLKLMSRNVHHDEFEAVKIADMVNDAVDLCQYSYNQFGIDFQIEGPSDLMVYAKKVSVTQTLVNLLNNSLHAIRNLDCPWVRIEWDEDQTHAAIRVIDAGNGIRPEVAEKMFTPFYTTKSANEGTGLGMSLSKQLIEEQNGRLFYKLENGHTSFHICLPKYITEPQKVKYIT